MSCNYYVPICLRTLLGHLRYTTYFWVSLKRTCALGTTRYALLGYHAYMYMTPLIYSWHEYTSMHCSLWVVFSSGGPTVVCTYVHWGQEPHSWLQPTSARWAGMVYIHTWGPPTSSPLDRPHSEVLILPECITWNRLCIIFESLLFPHGRAWAYLTKFFFTGKCKSLIWGTS